MTFETLLQNCLSDVEVKAMELLRENFRRNAFFGTPWPRGKNPARLGKKLLYQSGDLSDGYMSKIEGDSIHITNTVAYAGFHNEGAEIPVTINMKKFFWAMYYKSSGAMTKTKSGKVSASKRNVSLSNEAAYWKSLALMKVGTKIKIPERRVFGEHPQMDAAIERIIDRNVRESVEEMMNQVKP